MKKTVLVMAMAALTAVACKENQKADVLHEETEIVDASTTAPEVAAPINTQEELIKEAQSKPLTNLVLSENHYDFGKVKKGEKVEHVYEVTNTGTNPLIISQVKPGCGCTAPDYTKEPILPGQKGKITLSFDSSSFDGPQNKQAEVYANVDKTPVMLTFSADVTPN